MLPLILVVLAAPPARFEADRLTVDADGAVRAEGVRVSMGAAEVLGRTAERRDDADCADGRWHLTEVALRAPRTTAQAHSADACMPDQVTFTALRLASPGGRLSARHARLQGDRLTADEIEATACACADPPWRVTADRVSVDADGVWADWPVFWAGPVPLVTSPVGYLPLGRRRTGFLPPVLGWDGEDGLHGRLPFFWALGEAADLTLAPGWRMGRGLAGRARLRWRTDDVHEGSVGLRGVARDGATVSGQGSARWRVLRLGISGDLTTDPTARRAQFRGLEARARDHLALDVGLAAADATGGLGVRAGLLTDLRQPAAFGDQPGVAQALPEAWLGWRLPALGGHIALDVATQTRAARGADARLTTDLALTASRPTWVGPLRLRPVLGAATQVHLGRAVDPDAAIDLDAPAEAPIQQVLVAWAGAEAEVAVARRFGPRTHRLALVLDGRVAARSDREIERPLVAADAPFAARGVGAALVNRLSGGGWQARLRVRVGYEGALDAPIEPVQVGAALGSAWLGLDAQAAGLDAAWARLRVGPLDGAHALAGASRYTPGADLPWLRSAAPDRPLRWRTDVTDARTADAGLSLPLGPVRLDYRAVMDLADPGLRGQWGALAVQGGCGCWSARLAASHERGRAAPDLSLAFALTGL